MFEITIFKVDELKFSDGTKLYRLWFALDNGLAWIYSKTPYTKGQNAKLELYPMNTQDVKSNMRLGVRCK